jgi:hypothetical protein
VNAKKNLSTLLFGNIKANLETRYDRRLLKIILMIKGSTNIYYNSFPNLCLTQQILKLMSFLKAQL